MNPDVSAPEKAATAALGERPRQGTPARAPSQVSVEVLNGNGVAGAADDAAVAARAARLSGRERRQRGQVRPTSRRRSSTTPPSQVRRRPRSRWPTSSATGRPRRVQPGQQLDDHAAGDRRPDLPRRSHAGPGRPHAHAPAACGHNRVVAAGELKSVRKKAGFQLYTPTLRESSSSLSTARARAGVQGRRPQRRPPRSTRRRAPSTGASRRSRGTSRRSSTEPACNGASRAATTGSTSTGRSCT